MVLLFAFTLFTSAFLLFLVQPMVGKMILPALGGTPAVWNTCMVFFQAALLAGYAFAHQSVSLLGPRRQAGLQIVLLLVPLVVLPIIIDTGSVPPTDNPVWWLLWRLLLGVGLPLFVVSTNAPLLQRWFAETGHPAGKDPYFLYGASNLGSLLALLAYPVVVERMFPLGEQSALWAWGYRLLIALIFVCAIVMWRSPRLSEESAAAAGADDGRTAPTEVLGLKRCLRWVMLAFVPSSLMLGVTTFVTTDLAPVPLLWVLPLALYLLTFVFAFARRPWIPQAGLVRIFPFIIVPMAMLTVLGDVSERLVLLPLHLIVFFLTALVCHGELAADRPSACRLTAFYLLMSIGGVLGGLFNAVAAPLAFTTVAEYPIAMAVAFVVVGWRIADSRRNAIAPELPAGRKASRGPAWRRREVPVTVKPEDTTTPLLLDLALPMLLGAGPMVVIYALLEKQAWRPWMEAPAVILLAALVLVLKKRTIRSGLTLGLILYGLFLCNHQYNRNILFAGRNFYGPKEVVALGNGQLHRLWHGSTLHGVQWTSPPDRRMQPLGYYYATGPVGDVFQAFRGRSGPAGEVALIGLGAGGMAAYALAGQHFTFYEIDPEVVRIARDPSLFTFLRDCPGIIDVVVGDGRLTLGRAPDGNYGLILIDAFSSDAIPAHLLTREALRLYFSKLDAHGMLVLHVTNRYVNLPPLLAALARDAGLVCRWRDDMRISPEEEAAGKFPSQYVALARRPEDLGSLASNPKWKEVPTIGGLGVWTDQYTNIFRLLRW